MQLDLETHGPLSVISVRETRIVAASAIQFKDQMQDITSTSAPRFILNLEQVDFIDSSGLGAIVACLKQLSSGQVLEISNLSPTVSKVFRLTRMDTVFKIHEDFGDQVSDITKAG